MAGQMTVALDLTAFKDQLLQKIQIAVKTQIDVALEEFHTILFEHLKESTTENFRTSSSSHSFDDGDDPSKNGYHQNQSTSSRPTFASYPGPGIIGDHAFGDSCSDDGDVSTISYRHDLRQCSHQEIPSNSPPPRIIDRSIDGRFHHLAVSSPPFIFRRQSNSDAKSTANSKRSRAFDGNSHIAKPSGSDSEETAIDTFVAFKQRQVPYLVLSDDSYEIEQGVWLERTIANSTHPGHQFGHHEEDRDGQGSGKGAEQEALDSHYEEMSEDEEEEGGIGLWW